MISFDLPAPPSTNALTYNVRGRGRVKTDEYREWCNTAGIQAKLTKLGWDADTRQLWTRIMDDDEYMMIIHVPKKDKADIDNRLKATLDLFVSLKITPDDTNCQALMIFRSHSVIGPRIRVSIYPAVRAEAA